MVDALISVGPLMSHDYRKIIPPDNVSFAYSAIVSIGRFENWLMETEESVVPKDRQIDSHKKDRQAVRRGTNKTDRQTDRQSRESQTRQKRQTDRQSQTSRQRQSKTRQKRQTDRQKRQTDKLLKRHKQVDRESQTRQTERQINRRHKRDRHKQDRQTRNYLQLFVKDECAILHEFDILWR